MLDSSFVRDVRRDGDRAPEAVRGDELVGDVLRAFCVQVGDDHVRAALGEQPRGRASDPAGASGDERNPAGELAPRRCLRELVALERPVLDRERLALGQRAEAADRIRGVLHRDRAVIEVAGGVRLAASAPLVTMPIPGTSTTRGPAGSIGNRPVSSSTCLLVVAAIPAGVLFDAVAQSSGELLGVAGLGVERHDERLVLRVDQVVGARGADLAHLGRANRGRECDGMRAAVDLEHDAVRVREECTAERGKGSREEGVRARRPRAPRSCRRRGRTGRPRRGRARARRA